MCRRLGIRRLVVVLAGCAFPKLEELADGGPPAAFECPFSYKDVCISFDLAEERHFTSSLIVDTDLSNECAQHPRVPESSSYCAIVGSTITVGANAILRATGTRPLVFVSAGGIFVDGVIDVSSRRATRPPDIVAESIGTGGNFAGCSEFRRAVDSSLDGGGGGAGGTFGAIGGNGGDGNYDVSNALALGGQSPITPDELPTTRLRGGCRAQDGGGNGVSQNGGRGGAGGGVVYLATKMSIYINGAISANGAGGMGGGAQAGGGGGGSGGLIVLEAATVRRNGKLTANGGGGGEGGAIDGSEVIGADGANGVAAVMPAQGGNSTIPESSGGNGGFRNAPAGISGTFSDDAGGAGGGGVGFIYMITGATTATPQALESPMLRVPPS
jgi:hypothetical protein